MHIRSSKLSYPLIALAVMLFSALLARMPITKQLLKITDLRIYDTILDFHNAFLTEQDKGVYDDICIIDIDEKSISTLGLYSSWPSLFFADLLDNLTKDEPLAVGFDVFFTESDSIKGYARQRRLQQLAKIPIDTNTLLDQLSTDYAFSRAISDAGNVYLGMFGNKSTTITSNLPATLQQWDVTPRSFKPLETPHPPIPEFADVAYGVGFAHIEPDVSGIIHDYPLFLGYQNKYYVNFSFQMCLDLLGITRISSGKSYKLFSGTTLQRELPLSPEGDFYFKYYGPQRAFRYISFSDVLQNRQPPGFFKNRIVLVGSSASGLRDNKTTPLDQNYPGVELHATFIRNILEEDYVHWLNPWYIQAINAMLLLGLVILILKAKPLMSMSAFIVITLLFGPIAFTLYSLSSITFSYTAILLPWILGFTALFITQSHEQSIEKRKVRNAFEHYVSHELINQIMKGTHSLTAGGEKKTISIMFVDVRNFTSLCENLSPAEITGFMNRYFNLATEQITLHRGFLDKYIGDAVLGLFGVPISYPDFEMNAVNAGIATRDVALKIKEEYKNHAVLSEFKIGIGIATGEVVVGNIGSDTIFNYTGIGDRMNFCSRLEALNKYYHTNIIIDEATYTKVRERFLCRKLDRVTVKGKKVVSDIYEVIDYIDEIPSDSPMLKSFAHYETALALMNARHYHEAKEALLQALNLNPTDYPSLLMLERIEVVNWETWDGVWQHDHK
jgi:adenylate cyclase